MSDNKATNPRNKKLFSNGFMAVTKSKNKQGHTSAQPCRKDIAGFCVNSDKTHVRKDLKLFIHP